MRKKKLIEQKLNQLARSVRLNNDTVRDAAFELSRAENSPKPRRRIFTAVAAACAVIVIVLVGFFIVRSFNNPGGTETVVSYKLSSLQTAFASNVDTSAVPFPELENVELQQKLYTDNGETKVIATRIISATERGTDEIIVYKDLGNGLTDFDSYEKFSQIQTDNAVYTLRQKYYQGEYYSHCYYKDSKSEYYIVIMSPYSDAATYYFQKI